RTLQLSMAFSRRYDTSQQLTAITTPVRSQEPYLSSSCGLCACSLPLGLTNSSNRPQEQPFRRSQRRCPPQSAKPPARSRRTPDGKPIFVQRRAESSKDARQPCSSSNNPEFHS